MGTAYKRKGQNTWTARVTVGFVENEEGKLIQKYKYKGGFKTQTAALQYCKTLAEQKNTKKEAPTLQHYWDLYESTKFKKLSGSKQVAYKIAWRKWNNLHLVPIDQIMLHDIQIEIDQNASSYYPAKDMRTLLKRLFEMAAGEGFVNKDLPSLADIPSLDEKEGEPFTAEEQKNIWKTYESGEQFAAVLLIMIHTGIMPGEMMRMRIEMIDFNNAVIRGLGIKTKVRKKAEVVIPDFIMPLFEDLCGDRKDGKLIRKDERNFYKLYYEVLEKAGCRKLRPYSCRHTTATALAVDQNVAAQTLRKAMRWSSLRMASKYSHPSNDDVREALNSTRKPL